MAETTGSAAHWLTIEPILAVRDVAATAAYYRDVLGFAEAWLWGEPPTHGGARGDGVALQFSLDPALAAGAEGRQIWVRVGDVHALYARHGEHGAEIVSPLEPKPWGVSEYIVRDPNGYRLRFAGSGRAGEASRALPPEVRIEPRLPTGPELVALRRAVGWAEATDRETAPLLLRAALFGVVAVAREQTVGCAFLTGDGAGFYYVRDVIVHPEWQGRRVGTALMEAVMEHIRERVPAGAMVGLFTGPHLHGFYARFGFRGPGNGAYGMTWAPRKP